MAVWPMKRGPQGPPPSEAGCLRLTCGAWRLSPEHFLAPAPQPAGIEEEEVDDTDGNGTGTRQVERSAGQQRTGIREGASVH